jgi:hypothetical protein
VQEFAGSGILWGFAEGHKFGFGHGHAFSRIVQHFPAATLANNASPLVILAVPHEKLTNEATGYSLKLVN